MDNFGHIGISGTSKAFRKKRSNLYRRPQNESQPLQDYGDSLSNASTPPSDSLSKASAAYNVDYATISRSSYSNLNEAEAAMEIGIKGGQSGESRDSDSEQKDSQMDVKSFNGEDLATTTIKNPEISGNVMCNDHSGQLAVVADGTGSANRFKKVKLKIGGVTTTIHTGSVAGSCSTKSSSSSEALQPLGHKGSSGGRCSPNIDKSIGLQGIPWKNFATTGFSIRRVDCSRDGVSGKTAHLKQLDKYEEAQKRKLVSKRPLSGEAFSDEDAEDDNEIRYLEKLRASKYSASCSVVYEDDDDVGSKKQRKLSRVLRQTSNSSIADLRGFNSPKTSEESKKSRSVRTLQDTNYEDEEELVSDTELETKKKKQGKDFFDIPADTVREMAVTTRRRALQTGKNIYSTAGASPIEFPNGLPPPPPKKQKEKLSEVELQLKKAEAAQRRRMQAEKAAKESEAEAIRKILGQDSSRKKREDKHKKRQEELAQERTATVKALSSTTIRWVMGPSGTIVTFPNEIGLPSIFESKPCSYPPPREKCAGPSCMNAYKYRDSKSKLPLCSLQCYKAIHEKIKPLSAC